MRVLKDGDNHLQCLSPRLHKLFFSFAAVYPQTSTLGSRDVSEADSSQTTHGPQGPHKAVKWFRRFTSLHSLATSPSPSISSFSHDILRPSGVAVYCGARLGVEPAFKNAAVCEDNSSLPLCASHADHLHWFVICAFLALGHALAKQGRPLVYGGGSRGIMGVVSGAALQHGGSVTAVIPSAMVRAGGEGEELESSSRWYIELEEKGRENVSDRILVSMSQSAVLNFFYQSSR